MTDVTDESLASKLNSVVIEHFKGELVSTNELLVACGAILGGYFSMLPAKTRDQRLDQFVEVLRDHVALNDPTSVITPADGVETAEQVEARSRRNIHISMMQITWLPPPQRTRLTEWMLEFIPALDRAVHERRLEGIPAAEIRAAGVMVLSNMLDTIVINTTREKSARQSVRRNLFKLMQENIEGRT